MGDGRGDKKPNKTRSFDGKQILILGGAEFMLRTQWPLPQRGSLNIPNVLAVCETVKGHDTRPTRTHREKNNIRKLSAPVARLPDYRKASMLAW